MNINEFKHAVETTDSDDIERLTQLAVMHLRNVAQDCGKEGGIADYLLNIIEKLLEI